MDWLWKFAQDYGNGSKGTDFLSTSDGSESNDDATFNDPDTFDISKGEGQGQVPEYQNLNHPSTPDGESATQNSDQTFQGLDEHEPQDSARFVTQPFGEQMVDDNHANSDGGFAYSAMMKLFAVQGEEDDFLTSPTQGGPADSPQILNDGHADEELERDQNGVKNTVNEFDPTTKNDDTWIYHPDITDKNKEINSGNDAEINFGSTSFAHLKSRPSLVTHIPLKRKAATEMPPGQYHWGDDSNVEQIENPDEEKNLGVNKKEDFGTKDYGATTTMADAPNQTDSNDESKNYSGFNNTASSDLFDIITRKADYTAVMPSSNPNSGRSKENDAPRETMNDGKPSNIFDNVADKEFNDSNTYHLNHTKYQNKNRAGDDLTDYYKLSNSGAEFGAEGDGVNQSGVNNAV